MKDIKEIQPNGFYVFSGRSNANSCFIEKLSHAKRFLIYANYFLKGYLSIYEYMITKDGWIMVVKVKSKKDIQSLAKSNSEEVWKIISERIRLFLSTYVRVTNKQKGRTGSLVHSGYKRSYFESLSQAKGFLEKARNQEIKLYTKKKKYRAMKTHYQIPDKLGKGSIFLCSKEIEKEKRQGRDLGEVFEFIDFRKLVSLNLVNSTILMHNMYLKHQNPT